MCSADYPLLSFIELTSNGIRALGSDKNWSINDTIINVKISFV